MARNKKTTTQVESIKHKDKRANIPTEELRDFVAEDEHAPKTMRYARDPSLDPQLVWKGKDEQDPADLLNLIVEVTGEKKKDKAAKVATAHTLWVPAINNHGAFGRWAFIEISDPWDAQKTIRAAVNDD